MNNSIDLYNKAIKFYNEGYIDKALEYCEKSISSNLKNTAAINLKGLLYYFKGELEEAEALWKMNFQINRDLVSKKYLEDIENDNDKLLLYKAALEAIKELKLREAVNLLNKCKESDFNSINVNDSLTICYIKLGDYNTAAELIEDVFKIDRKNKIAIKNKKELVSLGVVKRKIKLKYIVIPIACIAFIFTVKIINKSIVVKNNNINEQAKAPVVSSNEATNTKKETNEKIGTVKVSENIFKSEEFNKAITVNDYEKLYSMANEWKGRELNINDKTLLQKGIELLKGSGIEYFYGKGRQALAAKDYKTSEKYFAMAYDYGKEYYLYQDILYMLGFSYNNDNQIDNCVKYYQEYDSKFPKGTYEETVLYDMTLIYKSVDVNVAKNYASSLIKQYPKSIYNNSVIKGILAE